MVLRVARWWLVVVGGVLLGAGLVLHGQVAMARYVQGEVDSVFFAWRAIGRLTFWFQSDLTRAALVLHELPPEMLRRSDFAAWVLVGSGGLLAGLAPWLWRRGGRRRRA